MFNIFGSLFFGSRPVSVAAAAVAAVEPSQTQQHAMEQPATQQFLPQLSEASTQTSNTTNVNTQTGDNEATCLSPADNADQLRRQLQQQQQQSVVEHDAARKSPSCGDKKQTALLTKPANELDWVIVDRSEEADKCKNNGGLGGSEIGVNTSMILSQSKQLVDSAQDCGMTVSNLHGDFENKLTHSQNAATVPSATAEFLAHENIDDNDVLLGSFFERHEREEQHEKDEEDEQMDVPTESTAPSGKKEDWLITPLPCLTSIISSQRSIVENDPLENLLIEHPSMSVFVTATSSSNSVDEEEIEIEQEKEQTVVSITQLKQHAVPAKVPSPKKKEKRQIQQVQQQKQQLQLQIQQQQQQQQQAAIAKRAAEKRKESEKSLPDSSENSSKHIESPTATMRKRGKKNRKSLSPSFVASFATATNNKENLQVKSLVQNDFKRSTGNQNRYDVGLLNKNQMKRNNINKTFSASKNVNVKQRKYHKLQQPAFNFSSNQQF